MRTKSKIIPRHILFSTVLPLAMSVAAANASAASEERMVLEEIVVTAQKREQSLQDVPVSIVALGQEQLEFKGIGDLRDLRGLVPNLTVAPHTNDPVAMKIFIRGVGQNDTQVTQDPSVALYLDGVYIGTSFGAGFEGVDLERIEVLRGPQGSLYGRNATGGAINLITRRADTSGFSFKQQLTAGNFNTLKSKTHINVPISDKLAAKLSYINSSRDGVVDNKGVGKGFGAVDRESVVADIRILPTDYLTIDYRYETAKIKDTQRFMQTLSQGNSSPQTPFITFTQTGKSRLDTVSSFFKIPKNDVEIKAHTLHIDLNINESNILRSITGARKIDTLAFQDFMPTAFVNFGGGAIPLYMSERLTKFEQLSQELQLIGNTDSLEYVAGFFYYEDEAHASGSNTVFGGVGSAGLTTTDNRSIAFFSQATYTPAFDNRKWSFTVGARYAKDKRQAFRLNPGSASFSSSAPDGAVYKNNFNNFTPSFTVAYAGSDNMNFYASVVKGYKTGGTSMSSPNLAFFQQGFKEEDVISYEAGFKGSFWDGRARINAALFYMDIDGLQTSVQTGAGPGDRDYLAIDGVKIKGVEIEGDILLTEGLSLNFGYGYLDTALGQKEILTPAGTFGLVDVLSYAPENIFTATLNYQHPLGWSTFFGSLSYIYHDKVETSPNVSDSVLIGDYNLVDASVGLSDIKIGNMPGLFKVMLWGKNITDEEYGLVSNRSFTFANSNQVMVFGDPRSYGITLYYEY